MLGTLVTLLGLLVAASSAAASGLGTPPTNVSTGAPSLGLAQPDAVDADYSKGHQRSTLAYDSAATCADDARVLSGLDREASATRAAGGGRARNFTYGDPGPGSMGSTDPYGNITIRPGLAADDLGETLRHETVHSVLSPSRGPVLDTRASIGAAGYDRSHALRFIEETAAETYATGSLRQGVNLGPGPLV